MKTIAKINKLTAKQNKFVNEYLIDLNATQAAIRAGYKVKSAREIGTENLAKPAIKEELKKIMDKRAERTEITQDYVLSVIRDTIERCRSEYEFNPAAVLKGTEQLGKHLGLFVDRHEHSGPDGSPVSVNVTFVRPSSVNKKEK